MATKMVKVCGRRTNTGNPQSWWVDTGVFVSQGDVVGIDATDPGDVIRPWGGHGGFGPKGDETTNDWEHALATITGIDDDLDNASGYENLWFGSLIGKIGRDGEAFYVGNARTLTANRSGTLFLAFNDGVNFEDNSGYWDVTITFEEEVQLASSGYGSNTIYANRYNGSLVDEWGVILTVQTGFTTPPEWDSVAIANLEVAFQAVQDRLPSPYTFKDVFGGLELRFYPTSPDEYGITFNENLIRFGQGTRNTVERLNERGFGRTDSGYYPSDYGFFSANSLGIQNTVIHELGHVLDFRSAAVDSTASDFDLKVMKGADASSDIGTFWENPSSSLGERIADNFLNWVRDSYVGIEGDIDNYPSATTTEQQRASAFWVGGIEFQSNTSPGIVGFAGDAALIAENAEELLRSVGLGESDENCSF
jgi:hypothetical protein